MPDIDNKTEFYCQFLENHSHSFKRIKLFDKFPYPWAFWQNSIKSFRIKSIRIVQSLKMNDFALLTRVKYLYTFLGNL